MSGPKIGLIGKPNVGKSTLFSALTEGSAEIGNYPFTTIKPNVGVTYFPVDCPHISLGTQCNPREGYCESGHRFVPITVIDVPGLIEGASQGKGMGNEFLENIRDSDAILLVFDASGRTAMDGSVTEDAADILDSEIAMVRNEMETWFASKISSGWDKFARKADSSGHPPLQSIMEKISSFGVSQGKVQAILSSGSFPAKFILWKETDFMEFSRKMFEITKPVILLGNKADLLEKPPRTSPESYLVSGDFELAASRAVKSGLVLDTGNVLEPAGQLREAQQAAIEKINAVFSRDWVKRLRNVISDTVKKHLKLMVVYPVYDDKKWTDKEGNTLPDAFLMPEGTTAEDLAFKVHTDIGRGFIKAINCRTGMVVGRDHPLADGDVIRIVAKA
ncbi:MAG: YchF-related putative GTPase [Thermoplasmataceae archaeon]